MIVELIVEAIAAVFSTLLNLLPDLTLPAWFGESITALTGMFDWAGNLGAWMPLDTFADCVTFLLVVYAIVWAIRISRMLLSLFTGGGGSAA